MTPPSLRTPRNASETRRAKQLSGIASASNRSRFIATSQALPPRNCIIRCPSGAINERMIKLKGCYLNCVTQAQNVRFKGSRLSPPRQNPRECEELHIAKFVDLIARCAGTTKGNGIHVPNPCPARTHLCDPRHHHSGYFGPRQLDFAWRSPQRRRRVVLRRG